MLTFHLTDLEYMSKVEILREYILLDLLISVIFCLHLKYPSEIYLIKLKSGFMLHRGCRFLLCLLGPCWSCWNFFGKTSFQVPVFAAGSCAFVIKEVMTRDLQIDVSSTSC